MSNNPDILINPQALPSQTERLGKTDTFSADSEIKFLPGEFHRTPGMHLGRSGHKFHDVATQQSGIEGLELKFDQNSAGSTNITFDCEQNPNISAVKMLMHTKDAEGEVIAAWSDNLIDAAKRTNMLTSKNIGLESAGRQGWHDFNHPTIILRVVDGMRRKEIRVTSHWKGTADNWNVDADISTGMLAAKTNTPA